MAQNQRGAAAATAGGRPEQSHAPRILRIGIVQGTWIVEERLIRKRSPVTIGQSSKNTFVVPASNAVPRSFVLFELVGASYALNFTDGMDGRIATEQSVPLTALKQKAQKRGSVYHLPISDHARGKIMIGDLTV